MTSDSEQSDATSLDLRRRISIRLIIAFVLLVGVAITWQVLNRSPPTAEAPAPGSAQQVDAGTSGRSTHSAATDRPVAVVPSDERKVLEAEGKVSVSAGQTALAAVPQEPAQPAKSAADLATNVPRVDGKNDPSAAVAAPAVAPVAAPVPAPAPKLPSGPYLQVGVFNHPENADKLKAQLEAQGIPVYLATRVQVGPFKNKKEAELMRKKLTAMGITSLHIRQ